MTAAIHRGGWDLSGISAAFEYVIQCLTTDRKTGRVLADWPKDVGNMQNFLNTCLHVWFNNIMSLICPVGGKCVLMSDLPQLNPDQPDFQEDVATTIDNVLEVLFGYHSSGLELNLRSALFASYLRQLRPFVKRCGEENLIFVHVARVVQGMGITTDLLYSLGDGLQKLFLKMNSTSISIAQGGDDIACDIPVANHSVLNLLLRQNEALHKVEAVVDNLVNQVKSLQVL